MDVPKILYYKVKKVLYFIVVYMMYLVEKKDVI